MKTVLKIEESEKCVHGLGGKVDEGSSMVNAIALLHVFTLCFFVFQSVSLCFPKSVFVLKFWAMRLLELIYMVC